MPARNTIKRWIGLAPASVALALTASAQAPLKQNVEFVHGCWMQDSFLGGGPAFLRLLPKGGHTPTYEGNLTWNADDISPSGTGGLFMFARDGTELKIAIPERPDPVVMPSMPPPNDAHSPELGVKRAWFAMPPDYSGEGYVLVEGRDERLLITVLAPTMGLDLFDGERDGCD